jgi:integrase
MNYTLPTIRDHEGDISKRWAVYWYVDGKRKVEWISEKIKSRKARYLEADKIIKEVSEQLKNGTSRIVVTSKIKLSTIIETALQFKKLYISFRTYQSYSNITYKLIDWVKANNYNDLPVEAFTKYHANQFIDSHFLNGKQYEAKTINTTIGYLHTVFERIKNCYPIPENPFLINKLIEKEPDSEIWTDDLKKKISKYLKKNCHELFIILLLVYHCYLRPDEIRKIQVKNINLAKGTIKISSRKGKSTCVKYPTISKQLKKLLAVIIKDLAPDTYIFSKGLKPGKKPISRNIISMRFKAIREKLDIPAEYKLYHFKHTGNSEMIDSGLNVRELQKQNGHSSLSITEKYLKRFNDSANKKIVSLTKEL